MNERGERVRFLSLAALFEGGLVLVAWGLAWFLRVDLWSGLRPTLAVVSIGLAGGILPFLLLLVTERFKFGPLERIKDLVLEILGPSLAACRWYDLALAAGLAGLGEELLFRGVMQPVFERWMAFAGGGGGGGGGAGRVLGLILSNVVFGLLHLITPTYAVLAGAMGIYFGLMLDVTGSRNLVAPIIAHGLYDYLAFLVLIRVHREWARKAELEHHHRSTVGTGAVPVAGEKAGDLSDDSSGRA